MGISEKNVGDMCIIKEGEEDSNMVDRISMLSDDLLGLILSQLPAKEQMATSILSPRWRWLWTLTSRLDLDGTDALSNRTLPFDTVKAEFVRMANHVVASRKGSGGALEYFKVHFDLDNTDEGCINEWLSYALSRKVERLDLNFNVRHKKYDDKFYAFPGSLHDEIASLKKLSLDHVLVDSEAFGVLLRGCPLLEELSISYSFSSNSSSSSPRPFSHLRIVGPLPSLKSLELNHCRCLDSLEICDVMHLAYFKYIGFPIHFALRNLPSLVHISISNRILDHMKATVPHFSTLLERLETFTIGIGLNLDFLELLENCRLGQNLQLPAEMRNLKKLEVSVSSNILRRDQPLLWLTTLIHSAPRLQKLVLQSERWDPKFPKRELRRAKTTEKSYPELKEVEFVGFCGTPSDIDFVFHFVDNAAALQKIRIDTEKITTPYYKNTFSNHYSIYKNVRDRLEKQLAIEKPWINLDFHIAKY